MYETKKTFEVQEYRRNIGLIALSCREMLDVRSICPFIINVIDGGGRVCVCVSGKVCAND